MAEVDRRRLLDDMAVFLTWSLSSAIRRRRQPACNMSGEIPGGIQIRTCTEGQDSVRLIRGQASFKFDLCVNNLCQGTPLPCLSRLIYKDECFIIIDEVSMTLLPIRVPRHEGRITANAPSASIQRLAPLHGTSGSYVNWCRTQAGSSGAVNI